MKCPHCATELRYRERGRRRCSTCKREFACEPKQNPLALTDTRMQTTAGKLSANGTLFYTPDQLLYALSRQTLAKRRTATGCLVPALVGSLFFGIIVGLTSGSGLAGLAAVLLLIGVGVLSEYFRREQHKHPRLPMGSDSFQAKILNRWQQIYGALPPGLLSANELTGLTKSTAQPQPLRAVLACPEPDILVCLRANGLVEQLGLALLPAQAPRNDAEAAIVAALRADPQLPLLVLHDASPAGCLLATGLPATLGLSSDQRVVDIGLHPRQAIEHGTLRLGAAPNGELLAQLKSRAAQADIPTQPHLSSDELKWLEAGNYSPLLGLPAARLLKLVRAAVRRTVGDSSLRATADPEQHAQRAAQAVGFMSWPDGATS